MTTCNDVEPAPLPETGKLYPPLLAILAAVLYFNCLAAPFAFDDWLFAAKDGQMRGKWALLDSGNYFFNRSFGNWTLKTNFELGGLRPAGFRAFNIAVHALAAISLFGLVRRTLRLPGIAPRLAAWADGLAATIALLWLAHPLQTQAVTYVVQRYESLMGLFFLLTLYFVVRGAQAAQPRDWYIAAWVACFLGAATKEVMAVCPLVVLLYDRAFLSGSFRAALRRRGRLYLALLLPIAYLFVVTRHTFVGEGNTPAGFAMEAITPWEYLRSQPAVLLHYLRLALWPDRLIFDYGWPIAQSPWEIFGLGAVIVSLLGLSLWATWKYPRVGFLGMAFFVILAPTSSIIPIKDLAFEHRMYLPLAAVIVLVVLTISNVLARLRLPESMLPGAAMVLVAMTTGALGVRTVIRNSDYNHPIRLWSQCIDFNPQNPRPYRILSDIYQADESEAALAFYRRAVELNPNLYWIWIDLGNYYLRHGQLAESLPYYEQAITILPKEETAYVNISRCRMLQGDYAGAAESCRKALAKIPGDPTLTKQLAWLLATADDSAVRNGYEACQLLEALPQNPKAVDIQYLEALSAAQAEAGDFDRAIASAEKAVAEARKVRSRRLAEFEARLRQYQSHQPHRTKVRQPERIAGPA